MLTFSGIHRYEPDDWSGHGDKFTDPERLRRIKVLLAEGRLLIVEHWHYRGSRAPDRIVIEDYDDLLEYLEKNAIAGDIVDIFDMSDAWSKKGDPVVSGKCPDKHGEIPKNGAY